MKSTIIKCFGVDKVALRTLYEWHRYIASLVFLRDWISDGFCGQGIRIRLPSHTPDIDKGWANIAKKLGAGTGPFFRLHLFYRLSFARSYFQTQSTSVIVFRELNSHPQPFRAASFAARKRYSFSTVCERPSELNARVMKFWLHVHRGSSGASSAGLCR